MTWRTTRDFPNAFFLYQSFSEGFSRLQNSASHGNMTTVLRQQQQPPQQQSGYSTFIGEGHPPLTLNACALGGVHAPDRAGVYTCAGQLRCSVDNLDHHHQQEQIMVCMFINYILLCTYKNIQFKLVQTFLFLSGSVCIYFLDVNSCNWIH